MAVDTNNIVLPIVHMNGTSRDALCEGRENAYDALREALEALKQTAPNGRDYYVGPADLLSKAIEQHNRRMQAITDLMAELEYECGELAF